MTAKTSFPQISRSLLNEIDGGWRAAVPAAGPLTLVEIGVRPC